MAKVLSIEVGYSLTRVCEVDYKVKNPKVYGSFTIATPAGTLEDGMISNPEALASVLKSALAEKGIKTKQVVYSINSTKIANREVFLPFVKENKIESLVEINASDYFPVNVAAYKLTYSILDTVETEGVKQYKLMVLAAPKDMLESYFALSDAAGLSVSALDYSGNSIATSISGAFKEGTEMVVKIDERSSLLTIFSAGEMVLQRTVPYGGDAAIETILEAEDEASGMEYTTALDIMRRKPCIRLTTNADAEEEADGSDEEIKQLRLDVTESLGMLSNGILRVIDYYNSRNSDNQIENIYLTGYAENFMGLQEYLSEEIGSQVKLLSELERLKIDVSSQNVGEYISCIGAVIDPMDFIPDEHNPKKKKKTAMVKATSGENVPGKAGAGDYTKLAVMVCVAGVLIGIILVVASLLPYYSAKAQKEELTKKEAELEPVEFIYAAYNATKLDYEDVQNMYKSIQTQNDGLVSFLLELQQKMPSESIVRSFSADLKQVSMNIDVDSKEAVALIVVELGKFESLSAVEVNSITEAKDEETGIVTVNFTVVCTYAPLEQMKEVQ